MSRNLIGGSLAGRTGSPLPISAYSWVKIITAACQSVLFDPETGIELETGQKKDDR